MAIPLTDPTWRIINPSMPQTSLVQIREFLRLKSLLDRLCTEITPTIPYCKLCANNLS
ncbi:unnamed protein product [Sphenostylis stenocarpa]|uniref:Uncharacterized protein n=1 Tax=Sphenostylis stenocarpa TaxID=92480 RepID=A0AA86SMU7_9FABA|nr:unnamed protein product [Sphenostylis stenocarpa]